jgi:hypothetical protein
VKITIVNRFRPFSHRPGTCCFIPGTRETLTAYPTAIQIADRQFDLKVTGPISRFTVHLDLERGEVIVEGDAREGFYRILIRADEGCIAVTPLKGPDGFIESAELPAHVERPSHIEHLSFGCHKKQEWELIQRRAQPTEFLPFWFQMAQWAPAAEPAEVSHASFVDLFASAFSGMLVPQKEDPLRQGLPLPDGDPLHTGAAAVRGQLLHVEGRELSILPSADPSWHCGRLLGCHTPIGMVDLEWTKKRPRRMIIHSAQEGPMDLIFPGKVRTCRYQGSETVTKSVHLKAGESHYFDRFEQ